MWHLNQYSFHVKNGTIRVLWNAEGLLKKIEWQDGQQPIEPVLVDLSENLELFPRLPTTVETISKRILRFFEDGIPMGAIPWEEIDQSEWSEFQKQVYRAIADIPYSETRTYGWVAGRVKKWSASRAVGQALRNNPLPILIPCHRVTAATSLGGFMGCVDPSQPELQLKQRLQGLEEGYVSPAFSFLSSLQPPMALEACG